MATGTPIHWRLRVSEPALHELLPAVKVCEAALLPGDPKLVYYPLLYLHGRGAVSFSEKDLAELTMHLDPGGGTLFADAACGDRAFDAGLRRLVGRLFPGNTLVPIPGDDELFSTKVGFDLSNSQHQGRGWRLCTPSARRSQDQRTLGDHLLERWDRLRPQAGARRGLQGLHS